MKLFAVTGRPVLYSKSPFIFNSCFQHHALPYHYNRLAADSSLEALGLFKEIGLRGMNVTAPFKMDIIPHLQQLDTPAKHIGAVNTVVRRGHILKGYNTDHLGVSGALETRGVNISGKRCLVIGAGGAGRAAVFALKQKGGEVILFNRDLEKARQAAEILGCAFSPLQELGSYLKDAQILVFTVPASVLSFDPNSLFPGQVLLDANYRDPTFAQIAAEKGLHYIQGEEWLKHQAIPAFHLFVGKELPLSGLDWRQLMESTPRAVRDNIALVGFMGSGKTAIGQALAARSGYEFLDVDDWIENQERKSIQDIFRTNGEAYFRRKEKEAIARFTQMKRTVLACGGGAILDMDNRRLLREHCLVVWIYTSLKTTFLRMEISTRPRLQHPRPFSHARNLLRRRLGDYFLCSDLIVSNEHTQDQSVRKIHEEIGISL